MQFTGVYAYPVQNGRLFNAWSALTGAIFDRIELDF